MIGFLKRERVLILFVGLLFVFHWFSKDITNPYERPIAGDAQGYYSYLPALLIYQDLDYTFIETEASQYYPPGGMKDFIFEVEGEKVNKTFPGVAVLYTPFFIMGHVSAWMFGFEPDGFSSIYQLWFDLGMWVYFFFGLVFLRILLEKFNFSSKIALFSTILIGLGTNVFFYTVYDQSVTHIHSFFMINGMLLCLYLWQEQKKLPWLIVALSLLALIGITRPTNILVFGLIFFFFSKKSFFLDVFHVVFSKNWWKIAVFVIPILSIPFLLWKIQTGKWMVYSYGDEGFNFADPHFFQFLFSYTKGWITYTPIVAVIIVPALVILFKQKPKKALIALGFYLFSIYVFSSWWCWYYGAGMSQRVMIDHYVLLAFFMATVLTYVWHKKIWRNVYLGVLISLAFLNVAQAYQIKNGIIQYGSTTQEGYWDSFLVFQTRARVYPYDHWEFIEGKDLSSPSWQSEVNETQWYSDMVFAPMQDLTPGSKLILSFEAKAEVSVEHSRAVLQLKPKANPEEEVGFPYFIKEFTRQGEWVYMEFMFEPSIEYTDTLKVYFWNGDTGEKVKFKNVKYEHYYSEDYL
ncbi:MAG: hypothetical protein HUJ25_17210 [Crocinitomicaceae bacterium]|nr:hypothetical protein [Crocinitomicaceae bacterium]